MTIFDLITSEALAAYWLEMPEAQDPVLGDELFPNQQKLGLDIKYIKGAKGLPVVLKPSSYDVEALKRDRLGFEKLSMQMPFFKESTYIDEELRQQLNMVLETGNQAYIDSVLNNVFDDEMRLLRGAKAQRERMKMMALTTGAINIAANGQAYTYDYHMPASNKVTTATAWSNPAATIIDDIRDLQDAIYDATGVKPTRAVCNNVTMKYLLKNNEIRSMINPLGQTKPVKESEVRQLLLDVLELEVVVNNKKYKNEAGTATKYVPDDTFAIFPEGTLGTGWFGTTPEQSDLMSSGVANVSIVDTGVAITTSQKVDPVQVETKVSQVCLPSFEMVDHVGIIDTTP